MFAMAPLLAVSLAVSLSRVADAAAQQWPQYHGPSGDRSVPGAVAVAWPDSGPNVVWTAETSLGFSSFAVGGGRAFTLVDDRGEECCIALDAATGERQWKVVLGSAEYDGGGGAGEADNKGGDGPRSTPSLDGDRVYVLDARLTVHCLAAEDGEVHWTRDLVAEHAGRNIKWQNAASPLIEGDVVLVAGGGEGESLLGLDKATGAVVWKGFDERITHATPIVATIHGVRQAIFYLQSGLLSVDPATGREIWRTEYPFRISTAASPVVDGDVVYASAGYGVGAAAWRVLRDDGAWSLELLWRKANKLMNHWSTPVVRDGHLYGMFSFKKYGKGPVMCVDIRTGETLWSEEGFGPGNAILVGDHLVALSDRGEVVVIDATPEAYRERARHDVLRGKCWSSPAFVDGRLFVRSTVEAVCLDVAVGS